MRRLATGALVAGLAVVATPAATTATRDAHQLVRPPATIAQYGYVRSLTRAGSTYRLRFDPALWLTGQTANRAAIEDGVIPPGDTVPNDYYIRNESKRQLTYVVPRNARVTVVTVPGGGPRSSRIAVSELAAIVKGQNPKLRKLYGQTLGFWARIVGDRAVALDQQYKP
jgi:hypothetical protein